MASKYRRNPSVPDYSFLRQYTIGADGKPIFHAILLLYIRAHKEAAILNYLDWFLKLPGVHVTWHDDRGLWYERESERLPYRHYTFTIDAEQGWCSLSDQEVAEIVANEYRTKIAPIAGKLSIIGTVDPKTGLNWRGSEYRLQAEVTSRSMRRLNHYMEEYFPNVRAIPQTRYHRDPKAQRYLGADFGREIYLDGAPMWTRDPYYMRSEGFAPEDEQGVA